MRQATNGDTVRVHYTGTFNDGTQFDSSAERGPIEVRIGGGQVIAGFEDALVGMSEGEAKNVVLEPENAYGDHSPHLVHEVERSRIPSDIDLEIGTALLTSDAEGRQTRLVVVDLSEESVTLDANHPLAGKTLTFELQLVGFVD